MLKGGELTYCASIYGHYSLSVRIRSGPDFFKSQKTSCPKTLRHPAVNRD